MKNQNKAVICTGGFSVTSKWRSSSPKNNNNKEGDKKTARSPNK
jgi:hypothetical protein